MLAAIAIVTTVLSSLLPALLVARSNPQAALQAASRGLGSRSVSGKLSGRAGGRRGRSFHASAGRNRPAVSHPLESWNIAAGIRYGPGNYVQRDARGRGGLFRYGCF